MYCTTVEAAKSAGASVRQLRHWAERGYVRPIRAIAHNGTSLHWSDHDVEAAAILAAVSRSLGHNGERLLELFGQTMANVWLRGADERPPGCRVVVPDGPLEVFIEVRPTT